MPTVNQTRGKLIGFAFLLPGWHFNEGVPAAEQTLQAAFKLVGELEEFGFDCLDAYPGIDGSVMVSAYKLPDTYDFNIKPSGNITVAHEREGEDDDIFYQEGMTLEEAQRIIKEFGVSQCHTPDYSTLGITSVAKTTDSKVEPLRTQKTNRVFLLSTSTVPEHNPAVFVSTLPDYTELLQARRSSSGKSRVKLLEQIGR